MTLIIIALLVVIILQLRSMAAGSYIAPAGRKPFNPGKLSTAGDWNE